MIKRWHMENSVVFVEAVATEEGLRSLQLLRKADPDRWRNCRIKSILQAYPSQVTPMFVYFIGGHITFRKAGSVGGRREIQELNQ